MLRNPKLASFVLGVIFDFATPLAAQEDDLILALGGDQMISLAVGYEQSISEAPAVATVITAGDIAAIGAYDVADVLRTVNGLHVSKSRTHDDLFFIRSIVSELNPHVLVMINGVPVGDAVQGGRPLGWSLPVQNISRIEIVRGPGSALYGADAFAGTINIITKDASELNGLQTGVFGGSFETLGSWAQYGVVGNRFELALSFEGQTTDGDTPTILRDSQTLNDVFQNTNASLAPGPLSLGRTDWNFRGDLKLGANVRIRTGYQGLRDIGVGHGGSFALDPKGRLNVDVFTSDLSVKSRLSNDIELNSSVSVFHENFRSTFQTFPPGAFGSFSAGVRTAFNFKLTELRGKWNALISRWKSHTINSGVGIAYQKSHDIEDRRNFFQTPSGTLIPATGFLSAQDLGISPNAIARSRTNVYGFIQDEWRIAPDWTLTAGVRVDHFTNIGTSMNPRASVVWAISPTTTAKLLYGRAFRPPTFLESTEGAGQIAIGNPRLTPEKIDTFELVFERRFGPKVRVSANGYYYKTKDLIIITPDPVSTVPTFMNTSGTNGHGLEIDFEYLFSEAISIKSGYAYQKAEFDDSNTSVGFSPNHQIFAESRMNLSAKFSGTFGVKYVSKRNRSLGDTRSNLDGYALGNLSLRYSPAPNSPLFATFSVDNVFDANAREPSTDPILAPEDIPLEGRRFLGRIGLRF